ncbi:phosphoenolpyruvate carboxykinase (ATP) [Candidatus Micrarchaeota archaeon]|nr:phosphoenolpyruvate carboxykinase (ATP) [Candidatus Micrarchaeota archaeon]
MAEGFLRMAGIIAKSNVAWNPAMAQLRRMAKGDERTTEYGSASYMTAIRSRSAKFTEIAFRPSAGQLETAARVVEYLRGKELISIDRIMCRKREYRTRIRLFVTKRYARLAYMWGRMLFKPAGEGAAGKAGKKPEGRPDFTIIDVPEWPERKVLVDPVTFTTFVLGTDYCGEVKKAGLRMMMYAHKTKRGGLGLHAGSKILRVRDAGSGKLVEKGMLLFGLSATGKTTLTCHHHWLNGGLGELVRIRQDDVVLLNRDGSAIGTEDNFYIKTDGLEPESQPLLYRGATSRNAILENVKLGDGGKIDFFDSSITSNGRGVVIRKELDCTDGSIDLPRVDMVVFITRRKTIVPPIAKLTPAQAAAFFMLGESIESSAGDPAQAGKPLRVVGTNPFIIGPPEEEGNRFLEILEANPRIECFLLDTGRFGAHPGTDDGIKITVYDSARLLADAARGAIRWKKDPDWGYLVPDYVPDVDMGHFDPRQYYSAEEYRRLTAELLEERRAWLGRFANLRKEIAGAI